MHSGRGGTAEIALLRGLEELDDDRLARRQTTCATLYIIMDVDWCFCGRRAVRVWFGGVCVCDANSVCRRASKTFYTAAEIATNKTCTTVIHPWSWVTKRTHHYHLCPMLRPLTQCATSLLIKSTLCERNGRGRIRKASWLGGPRLNHFIQSHHLPSGLWTFGRAKRRV